MFLVEATMKTRIILSGMLLLAFACSSVFAQLLPIRTYGTSDGLPQSEVVCIYQDRLGYVWFGTYENGLARYDGRSFQRIPQVVDLSDGAVQAIFEDRHGAIWIGTEKGLIRFALDSASGDTTIVVFTKAHGLPDNRINSIVEDARGRLWVGTAAGACCLIDNAFVPKLSHRNWENNLILSMAPAKDGSVWMGTSDGVNIWQDDSLRTLTMADGLPSNLVRAVFCDRDEVTWLGTTAGLVRVHNNVLQTFKEQDGLSDTEIYALEQDQKGLLWIGARTGLSQFDPALASDARSSNSDVNHSFKNAGHKSFRHFGRRQGLSVDRIATLFVDYENNLWIGTWGGGACKLQLHGNYLENYTLQNGLPAAPVYSLFEDSGGRIWIGTNGGGLAIVDGDSLIIHDTRTGLPNNVVHALAQEPSGSLWIGTHGGAVRLISDPEHSRFAGAKSRQIFTRKSGLPDDRIRNIFCAPSGEVWLATTRAGAVRYIQGKFTALAEKEGLPSNAIQAIHQDRQGRLWIATNTGLVLRHGDKQKVFRRDDGLPAEMVICIFEDHAGDLWFGTRQGGATLYANGKFHTLCKSEGLADNVVYFIIEDRQQRMWFGTNLGVDCFSGEAIGEFKRQGASAFKDHATAGADTNSKKMAPLFHLAARHGLADNECNTRAALCDRDGNLWFGTAGGATKLYPDRLPPVTPPPRVHIKSIEIGDQIYAPAGATALHVLPWKAKGKATIDFFFSTLSFLDEQYASSQVYLEGFDNGWTTLENTNRVRYINLPPGLYTFQLRGVNAFDVPSAEAAKLQFEILPPFYRSLWFIVSSIILVAGLIYGGHLVRLRQVHQRNEELEKAVEEKTHGLQEAHAFLSSIKDFLPVGLIVVNPQRFVVEANRACVELFDYTQDELHGQELHNLLSSEKLSRDKLWSALHDESRRRDLLAETQIGGLSGIELIGLRRDGEKFPCNVHACSVRDERGKLQYVILTCENIVEEKLLEQRLIENEKRLALVDLMAGMGDILNNKLAGVQGYLDLLKNALTVGVVHRQGSGPTKPLNPVEVIGWAQNSTTEMSAVLRQLIEFGAYLAKIPVLPVDLRKILCDLAQHWRKDLHVRLPEMPEPIPVKVIPRLKSGLDEAIQNSKEADATEVDIHVEKLSSLGRIRLTLTDNGRGISPVLVNKVFLPFFKTKATPHPGLGLWKLRQLVQQSGGAVEILSLPKGGTQLVINLPAATLDQLSDDAAAQVAAVTEHANLA
jgi:PAS domain S-box-containing protein